jgi:uncharacterized protein (TIGR02466 family)
VLLLNNGGIFLFPPEIWKYQYKFDYATLAPKIENLFNLVEENSKLEKGNAVSTVSLSKEMQPHTWDELSDFQQWLGEKIAFIRRDYCFINGYSAVTDSWLNRHQRSGETIEHNHNNVTFTVAAYIKLPPNSGYIEFKDPLEYHKTQYPIIPEQSLYKQLPCETNDVLIFPGYLRHRVQPNLTDNERIVLTFNIK